MLAFFDNIYKNIVLQKKMLFNKMQIKMHKLNNFFILLNLLLKIIKIYNKKINININIKSNFKKEIKKINIKNIIINKKMKGEYDFNHTF